MTAILCGIGLGPGDPELITVKGLRRLHEARFVFVPATRPGHSYAREIAHCHIESADQVLIELVCPPLRARAALEQRWAELAEIVAEKLGRDGNGVFLTEGDPALYSTFDYLVRALRRDYPAIVIDSIPGISSPSAAAAVAGVPLATWNERLAILPASHDASALPRILADVDSAALLKVSSVLPEALAAAECLGLETTFVQRVGRSEERVETDPDAILATRSDYFSLLLVRRRGST